MNEQSGKSSKTFDYIIFGFTVLFLATLTNSIFLNQLGYFGALTIIIIRYFKTKKNPFSKTGLELAFIIYIAAEILSTIFSVEPAHSFHNLTKRFLLIPIVYTFLSVTEDIGQIKKFIIIYLAASVLTMCTYLVVSYQYFINNLYQLQESGPGLFQYPITSSELMSFSLTILFAFLINEKTSRSKKLLLFVLFAINFLALLATYKRTGLVGATAGLFIIILLKKKWYLIAPIVIVLAGLLILEKNVSQINIYKDEQGALKKQSTLNTKGRPFYLTPLNNIIFVSDYENGILKLENGKVNPDQKLDAPVTGIKKLNDSMYVASLVDTRFAKLKLSNGLLRTTGTEFMSPGFTVDWKIANGCVYAADKDSGITVFDCSKDPKIIGRYSGKGFENIEKIFTDSSSIVLFSRRNGISIYSLKNNLLDSRLFNSQKAADVTPLLYINKKLLVAKKNSVSIQELSSGELKPVGEISNMPGIIAADKSNGIIFFVSTKGELYRASVTSYGINVVSHQNLGYVPASVTADSQYVYASLVKRGRFASIVDPYNPSNFGRLSFWRAGLKIFMDYPVFGVGDIDLAKLFIQYKRPYDKEIQGHMHNNFIHILVTLGLVGFTAFMILIWEILVLHFKNYFKVKNIPFASSYVLGAVGGFVAFLVAGLTEWNFGDHEIITMVWFTLAMSIAVTRSVTAKQEDA